MTVQWQGWFRDGRGTEPIVIQSDGHRLGFLIRGTCFEGQGLDDFEPMGGDWPGEGVFTVDDMGGLRDCSVEWEMPLPLTTPAGPAEGTLACTVELGPPDESSLALTMALSAKAAYRRVSSKDELFEVWPVHSEFVQETWLCGEFEHRPTTGEGTGYRGPFPSAR